MFGGAVERNSSRERPWKGVGEGRTLDHDGLVLGPRQFAEVRERADVLVEEPEAAVHVGGAAAGRIPGEAEARSEVVFVAAPLVTLVEGDLEGKAAVASELVLDPLK